MWRKLENPAPASSIATRTPSPSWPIASPEGAVVGDGRVLGDLEDDGRARPTQDATQALGVEDEVGRDVQAEPATGQRGALGECRLERRDLELDPEADRLGVGEPALAAARRP